MSDQNDDVVLKVENLNLVFKVDVLRGNTLRDVFTHFLGNPLKWVKAEQDRLHIAKNINLTLRKGERLGVLGVNGAGKTSLCRCLAGMYQPTSGSVTTHGPIRAIFNTSMGIQPELTGRENAELFTHLLYPDVENPDEMISDALEFSELGRFVDVPYKLYSNGMQARLCLSLISARPAGLLILDEVFDGADSYFKEKISVRIMDIIQRSGAVVFVSHSPDQVERVCNRAVVLHNGEIAFDGPPVEAHKFYEQLRPKNTTNPV